jgi:integrase
MPTVREICTLYLRHCEAEGVHGPAAKADRHATLGWFCQAHGDLEADQLKPFHLSDWIAAHPTWKRPATRRSKANAVRACFKWAWEGERIARHPFATVRYGESPRRPEMPDDTLERLAALANKRYEQALRFLRLTGCRLSELCAARWDHVDLDRGVWTVPTHKSFRYTLRPKTVPLVPEAVELLRHLAGLNRGVQNGHAGEELNRGGSFVFLNNRGTPWTRATLGNQLRRMKARFGVEDRGTLHGIRHRLATAAIAAGAPVKLVAEQLGHAGTVITEKYYWHRSDDHLDAIREAAQLGMPKKVRA